MARAQWWGAGPPPASARRPRLASARHPAATGTYGPALCAWAESQKLHAKASGGTRWWQRAALNRALEHDAAGRLCWPVVVISCPRQAGKSWIERMVCSWRIHQAGRFGEEQTVLHIAHKLVAAQEVWRPVARSAPHAWGAVTRWANGEQQVELPDGSRWLLQAATDGAGVAFSLSMALVDEGWRVARSVYDEAIEPALAEAESPQTFLVSTAGTAESDLMAVYRAKGLAGIDNPGDPGEVCLIEWSAPPDPDLDIDDPRVWRASQPHWDARREAWIRRKRETAGERAFRQQALNQWVPSLTPPALAPGTYGAVATRDAPSGALAFGAEVAEDHSRAVIVAYGGGVAELVDDGEQAGWVAGRLAELAERHGAVALGLDGSGPARGAAAELARTGLPVTRLTGSDMGAACGQMFDALCSRPPGVRLRDHAAFEDAVNVVRWRRAGGGRAWDRDDVTLALNAATVARWAHQRAQAAEQDLEEPAVF